MNRTLTRRSIPLLLLGVIEASCSPDVPSAPTVAHQRPNSAIVAGTATPVPTLNLATPLPILAGQTVTVRGSFSDDDPNDGPWTWRFYSDGVLVLQRVQATLPPPGVTRPGNVIIGTPGNHTLVLTVTDKNGGIGADTLVVPSIPIGGPSQVTVSGRQLQVRKRRADGTLGPLVTWVMRGANWTPASTTTATSVGDPNNAKVRRREFWQWTSIDVPLLASMHVNSVRLFMDPGADSTEAIEGYRVLNELYSNGIMVIMTVDDAINDLGRVSKVVSLYKSHPAVLFWMLGNEWNINRYNGAASTIQDAALRTEQAAVLAKSLDALHPVATGYGEIDINAPGLHLADTQGYVNSSCPSVDIWGVNIYRGSTFTNLFQQWGSISTKPVFVAEYGTDAWDTTDPLNPVLGHIDEAKQAQWDANLWSDLYRNLSANDPQHVALGGAVFAFSDEWWKVQPSGSQQSSGFVLPGGHPDGFANEEYFGLTDIFRTTRQAYGALQSAFNPTTVPPKPVVGFGSTSQGYKQAGQEGCAEFFRDGGSFARVCAGTGGGRGFNVAVLDSTTGTLLQPVASFDTYGTLTTGTAMYAMIAFLQGLPNGTIVLIAIADEAGLTDSSCNKFTFPWVIAGLSELANLGSTQIGNYCFRNAWTMIAVKGEGTARGEQLKAGMPPPAVANATVTISMK